MQHYFEGFVSEDTEQAWQKLKSEMPWNVEGVHSTAIMELGLKSIELDIESDRQLGSLLESTPSRCLWFEFYVHPFLAPGHEDFYPFIINCQQISLMEGLTRTKIGCRRTARHVTAMANGFTTRLVEILRLFTKGRHA